jgi:hypothetical protein
MKVEYIVIKKFLLRKKNNISKKVDISRRNKSLKNRN